MDIDLVKLKTLVEVRDSGSMTAAASTLGYTTGAVSQQMATLARSVQTELFEQVGRRVRPTDAGNLLADHAVRLLAIARQAEQGLAALHDRPQAQVTIGVFGTTAMVLLPRAMARVRDRYPKIHLRSVEIDVDTATADVAAGRVDLAFGVDYPEAPIPRAADVALLSLWTERFAIALQANAEPVPEPCPRKSRRTARAAEPLTAFADQPWILPPAHTFYAQAFRATCRRAGFEPDVKHTVTDTAATLTLVAEGLGIAPVTDLMLALRRDGLRTVPLFDRVERTMVLAHPLDPPPQPGVQAVIDTITQDPSLFAVTRQRSPS